MSQIDVDSEILRMRGLAGSLYLYEMKYHFLLISVFILSGACKSTKKLTARNDDKISFTIVQVNDVYEIAPLTGGKVGWRAWQR